MNTFKDSKMLFTEYINSKLVARILFSCRMVDNPPNLSCTPYLPVSRIDADTKSAPYHSGGIDREGRRTTNIVVIAGLVMECC